MQHACLGIQHVAETRDHTNLQYIALHSRRPATHGSWRLFSAHTLVVLRIRKLGHPHFAPLHSLRSSPPPVHSLPHHPSVFTRKSIFLFTRSLLAPRRYRIITQHSALNVHHPEYLTSKCASLLLLFSSLLRPSFPPRSPLSAEASKVLLPGTIRRQATRTSLTHPAFAIINQ